MQISATILSFRNLHDHGPLFQNFFAERRQTFIAEKHWPMPEEDGLEFDQYDTPQSRWVAVHREGEHEVLGGFRLTRSTARCGIYSYMIRDACLGLLPSIPKGLIASDEPPVDPGIWECSRGFVVSRLPAASRKLVRRFTLEQMLPAMERLGGHGMVVMTTKFWTRWMPMHGIEGRALGPAVDVDGEGYHAVMMCRPAFASVA
ncbi:acyl-homoserine-lactone synthase [Paracoccus litorisediminis]|uniref:acyl-homoserine-lactone synthase n=1 Tax=Paracoccus litorisediminis TaxID=2006130 RepID=UPI003733DD4A